MNPRDYCLHREEALGFRACSVPDAAAKARRRKAKVRPVRRRFMMVMRSASQPAHLGTFVYRPDEFYPGEWEDAKLGDIINSDGDEFMRVK